MSDWAESRGVVIEVIAQIALLAFVFEARRSKSILVHI